MTKAKTIANGSIANEAARIIDSYGGDVASTIGILQEIQSRFNHLPKEALVEMSKALAIPLSQVFSLATFYKAFTLNPRGKHLVSVCLGTACHVKGAPRLVDELRRRLKVKPGETTSDGKFTLIAVNCLGCCALGPVMVVDDKYYEQVTSDRIDPILKKY